MRRAFLALAAVALVGCAAPPAPMPEVIASQPAMMKLRRVCRGCPNYVITLTSDGILTYEGGEGAAARGTRTTNVGAALTTAMIAEFLQSGFIELDNAYPAPGEDRMTLALSIEMNGITKAVISEDRYGPQTLLELERRMDDLPGMRALSGWVH